MSIIRAYRQEDQSAVLDIWLAASRVGHPFFSEAELLRQYGIVRDQYLHAAEIWIAENETGPAGFIAMLGPMIGALFVAPEQHGKGIGSQLISAMQKKYGEIEVGVLQPNASAHHFYCNCGFVEFAREETTEVNPPQTVILMRLGGAGKSQAH
ncbi:GNAT family N-acetyltransferase [Oleidesulfovibrio sp.]|uniref:GNAT family N-acetyltransferase n=1 Tax=Oleidesulfovibrio sp. TaxID=2909707 RepID=UPI003A869362